MVNTFTKKWYWWRPLVTEQNRVVLITGETSNFFEQAIFIVKKNIPENKVPVDFVAEAEKIISAYIARKYKPDTCCHYSTELELDMMKDEMTRRKRGQKFNIALNLILTIVCSILLYFVMK
jgi:hypothetical protein